MKGIGIPYQEFLDTRTRKPLPFIYWVAERPDMAFLPPSFYQLVGIFHAVSRMYGFQLNAKHADLEGFMQAALEGGAWVRSPRLYLACSDREELVVCFDWHAWIATSGIIGG